MVFTRPISTTSRMVGPRRAPEHEGVADHPKIQDEKPLNPHTTKTNSTGENGEVGVGEMEGGQFKVEPLHRSREDANTIRARLLCSGSRRLLWFWDNDANDH